MDLLYLGMMLSYLSNEEIGSFRIDSDTNTYEPYDKQDIDVVIMMDCSLCR